MMIDRQARKLLFETVAQRVIASADELTDLDRDIGEGGAGLPLRLKATARAAAEQTIPMRAIRGRASFLGERSVGHMDPGARSSALIVDAVADVMEGLA